MEGIDWAFSSTPPIAAYQAVCETTDEADARRNRDASLARTLSSIPDHH